MSVQTGMNAGRTIRKGICLLLAGVMSAGSVQALPKRDVSDPVLQEIIAAFAQKMPRYIDKHGESVYVTDEPITRASLMYALYEYDKSIRFGRKENISREEFDELSTRLAQLEKKNIAAAKGKLDIIDVINGLEPNMGMLLDNSLASSKVFMNLKNEVEARPVSGAPDTGDDTIGRTRAEMADLERRMDALERNLPAGNAKAAAPVEIVTRQEIQDIRFKLEQLDRGIGQNATGGDTKDIQASLAQTERNMAEMTRRLYAIENRNESGNATGANEREVQEIRTKLDQLEKSVTRGRSADESRDLQPALAQTERDMAEIARRLNALEHREGGRGDTVKVTEEVKKASAQTQGELMRLDRRIDEIERRAVIEGKGRGDDGALQQYTSGLTKIALGLGMVAAFFIAR